MTQSITPKNIVLYADDDADDLLLVTEAFAHYARDVEVVTVSNGLQALAFLQQITPLDPIPCLIILDINMPLLDGKQVLIKLRQMDLLAQIPVVLFSTSSLPMDKDFARRYGAGFITKPLNLKQMELITEQFISHCAEEVRKKIRRQTQ
ncbi:MAG: response regulator [Flaviaesturariibacter sp.]|nr:response regulator [Flaviaesturariibacter sp.]